MIRAAALALGASLALAPITTADSPRPGCQQQAWWYGSLGRLTTRTICDGPLLPDGTWHRCREFYAPAYTTSGYWTSFTSTPGYGVGIGSGTYTPPRDVPEFIQLECYTVSPDSVLDDEPGHLT